MSQNFNPKSPTELNRENNELIEAFSEVVDSISSLEDKRRILWKNIYANAVADRSNAYLCFSDLYLSVHGNSNEHAIHGITLTKYLERMSKANEQLIKLADLISKIKEADNYMESDDALDKVQASMTMNNPFSRRKN